MKETIVKINTTKSWLFEKINKTDKPLARLMKKKREKNKLNEKGEVTTDNVEIQRIIRDYYEQLYGNKMDNLEINGQVLRKVKSSKSEPERNRNYEQLWGASSAPAKVLRKEAWHTQRRDRASGVSLEILEHLPPKPESAYFLLCAFTYASDFTGGCPPLPLSEKRVSLHLQLIIPGCDSVSTYKLLWKSSSLPE